MTATSYVDRARSACLCSVGGGPYVAAVLVADDGREDFVLVQWDLIGDESHTYDDTTAQAPHERTGPLPKELLDDMRDLWAWRDRHPGRRLPGGPLLNPPAHRCGRPTAAGGHCRIEVDRPGGACHWHRRQRADSNPTTTEGEQHDRRSTHWCGVLDAVTIQRLKAEE